MTEIPKGVEQVATVPATSQEPAIQAQPNPAVDMTGASSGDVKTVPLPALQEERSKRQALEAEMAALKQAVAETQYQQQAQVQVQHPQADPKAELEKLWEEEPRKAVQVEIMYAMDWRDRVDSALEMQADQLAAKYPDFNKFRSTALGQVRSLPLNQRGGPGIVEAAYFMVRGQNTDTALKQQEAELLEKYRRGEINAEGLTPPAGAFTAPTTPAGSLTQEELTVASMMGLSEAEYIANKRR